MGSTNSYSPLWLADQKWCFRACCIGLLESRKRYSHPVLIESTRPPQGCVLLYCSSSLVFLCIWSCVFLQTFPFSNHLLCRIYAWSALIRKGVFGFMFVWFCDFPEAELLSELVHQQESVMLFHLPLRCVRYLLVMSLTLDFSSNTYYLTLKTLCV